ncbi:MAG: lipoate--protein ligase family protein [Prevotellaceae bacterium]|jgi:lipoate-protein ligase A|nr:lipoate--protein ligase family protein [Prevotellaceae bacterium]
MIILSPHSQASQNCALEQQLLAERSDDLLLFYVNAAAVVVGRNQTMEAEVDVDFCAAHGIEVVRRISGGGAVFHDLGNINFAFIVNADTSTPALDRNFLAPVVAALQSLGVPASVGLRHDIRCGGYKISGTASHVSRGRQLFHGTLLHRVNLDLLHLALNGKTTLRGRGVASFPDRVANIASLVRSDESTPDFLRQLMAAMQAQLELTALSRA